jgi:hypothetical protein
MKQRGIPIFLIVAVAALIIVMRSSPRGQSGAQPKLPAHGEKIEVDKEQWPMTDYNATEPGDPVKRDKRRASNARHDKEETVREPDMRPGHTSETTMTTDWEVRLPELPAYQSDAVIVGEVLDAGAYLSNDKTGVYSEFTIKIADVLKNDSSRLTQGSSLVAERLGGRVRFPSGGILPVTISGQGMPRAGRRYVFFLKRIDQGQTYDILTGYELRAGKVSPLDGRRAVGGGHPWAFDKYEGWDEGAFMDAVRIEIANPSS